MSASSRDTVLEIEEFEGKDVGNTLFQLTFQGKTLLKLNAISMAIVAESDLPFQKQVLIEINPVDARCEAVYRLVEIRTTENSNKEALVSKAFGDCRSEYDLKITNQGIRIVTFEHGDVIESASSVSIRRELGLLGGKKMDQGVVTEGPF